MKYLVTYMARSGDESDAEVDVREYPQLPDAPVLYYATNLRLWGCGKNAATPEGAIRLLVQDMATILDIRRM
jgi:hypothetical protein